MLRLFFMAIAGTTVSITASAQSEFINRSSVVIEQNSFFRSPQFADQSDRRLQFQASLKPEFEYRLESGLKFNFEGLVRVTDTDKNGSYADIRRLSATYRTGRYLFNVGFEREFWGVTESRHLVDILNQTDTMAGIDGEDKFGQPLVKIRIDIPGGNIDFYKLLGFRERTFPDEGRFRFEIPLLADRRNAHWHIRNTPEDFAVRLSQRLGNHEFSVSHFSGISREPTIAINSQGNLSVQYEPIDQTGVEYQGVFDATLVKFESIYRDGHRADTGFWAMVGGFEHTLYSVFGGSADVGLIAEYNKDERKPGTPLTLFQNDLFLGTRWVLNDLGSTSVLTGAFVDFDGDATAISAEFDTRLNNHWTLSIEARGLMGRGKTLLSNAFKRDDFVQIRFSYFF